MSRSFFDDLRFHSAMNLFFNDMERRFFGDNFWGAPAIEGTGTTAADASAPAAAPQTPTTVATRSPSSTWLSSFASNNITLDVKETDAGYNVIAELPGFKPEDIKVTVDEGVLTISSERKEERKEDGKDGKFHVQERRYGKVSRSLRLPRNADWEKAAAHFEHGELHLDMPKRAATTAGREIPVKSPTSASASSA
jgi:HSP20 family molecular chaperone IbpA